MCGEGEREGSTVAALGSRTANKRERVRAVDDHGEGGRQVLGAQVWRDSSRAGVLLVPGKASPGQARAPDTLGAVRAP